MLPRESRVAASTLFILHILLSLFLTLLPLITSVTLLLSYFVTSLLFNIVTTVTLLLTLLLCYALSLIVKHLFNLRASVCVVLASFLLFLMLSLESLFSPLSNTRRFYLSMENPLWSERVN